MDKMRKKILSYMLILIGICITITGSSDLSAVISIGRTANIETQGSKHNACISVYPQNNREGFRYPLELTYNKYYNGVSKASNLEKEYHLPKPKPSDALKIIIDKNQVKMYWRVVFQGKYIDNRAFNKAKTYHNIIKEAIKDKWSGSYTIKGHKTNLKTFITDSWLAGQNEGSTAPELNYGTFIFHKKRGVSNVIWSGRETTGTINIYTGDSRTNYNYSYDDFRITVAHEFGHILGIGDGYYNKDTQSLNSIMCDVWGDSNHISRKNRKATSLDIKKALDAYKSNKWQDWN